MMDVIRIRNRDRSRCFWPVRVRLSFSNPFRRSILARLACCLLSEDRRWILLIASLVDSEYSPLPIEMNERMGYGLIWVCSSSWLGRRRKRSTIEQHLFMLSNNRDNLASIAWKPFFGTTRLLAKRMTRPIRIFLFVVSDDKAPTTKLSTQKHCSRGNQEEYSSRHL